MVEPYWTDLKYLETICHSVPGNTGFFLTASQVPVVLFEAKKHMACPPGFLSPRNEEQWSSFYNEITAWARQEGYVTAFLQYRGNEKPPASGCAHNISSRKVVYIPLRENTGSMMTTCRRDTRSRLRSLEKQGFRYESKYGGAFARFYDEIATTQDFSISYRYSADDLENIAGAAGIFHVSIYADDGTYIGGAIMGHVDNDMCDYILSAYDRSVENSGRAVLWYALMVARNKGYTQVNLGGGIEDDDSLYQFKMSFGGEAHSFYSVKTIFDEEEYVRLYDSNFDLSGRFPPT